MKATMGLTTDAYSVRKTRSGTPWWRTAFSPPPVGGRVGLRRTAAATVGCAVSQVCPLPALHIGVLRCRLPLAFGAASVCAITVLALSADARAGILVALAPGRPGVLHNDADGHHLVADAERFRDGLFGQPEYPPDTGTTTMVGLAAGRTGTCPISRACAALW